MASKASWPVPLQHAIGRRRVLGLERRAACRRRRGRRSGSRRSSPAPAPSPAASAAAAARARRRGTASASSAGVPPAGRDSASRRSCSSRPACRSPCSPARRSAIASGRAIRRRGRWPASAAATAAGAAPGADAGRRSRRDRSPRHRVRRRVARSRSSAAPRSSRARRTGTTMFRPSAAPRWKIVTSTLRRLPPAAAVRVRKPGAKPRLSSASPPFRSKTRLESWQSSRLLLPMQLPAFLPVVAPGSSKRCGLRTSGAGTPASRAPARRSTAGRCPRQRRRGRVGRLAAEQVRDRPRPGALDVGRPGQRGEIDAHAGHAIRRQVDREVHPADQRAGVDPRVGRVRVAGRRLREVERHAELRAAAAPAAERVGDVGAGSRAAR